MDSIWVLVGVVLGLAIGLAVGILLHRAKSLAVLTRNTQLESETTALQAQLSEARTQAAVSQEKASRIETLEGEIRLREQSIENLRSELRDFHLKFQQLESDMAHRDKAIEEKIVLLDQAEKKLSDAFQALSSNALQRNNQSFLELAKETLANFNKESQGDLEKRQQAIDSLIKPINESLTKVEKQIQDIEVKREGAYQGLSEQVKGLLESQVRLDTHTRSLVGALKSTSQRGRWGEIQLENLVQLSGMIKFCDFTTQESVDTDDGKLRPDLIIRLPNSHQIIVDSKAPIANYLEGHETEDDDQRKVLFSEYAKHVRSHINRLSEKKYWEQFKSAEFVIMFLPGEPFLGTALQHDPELIEYGFSKKVFLATPTTLLLLLRTVAYGWRQEQLAEEAQKIADEGKKLHKSVADFMGNFQAVGKSLNAAKKSYDTATYNLNSKVAKSAERLAALGAAGSKAIPLIADPLDVEESYAVIDALPESTELESANGLFEESTDDSDSTIQN